MVGTNDAHCSVAVALFNYAPSHVYSHGRVDHVLCPSVDSRGICMLATCSDSVSAQNQEYKPIVLSAMLHGRRSHNRPLCEGV